MAIRVFQGFGDVSSTCFWLTFPESVRESLESTLVNLIDKEAAADSFFDIVPKAIDVDRRVASFIDAALMGTGKPDVHLDWKMRANPKFLDYNLGRGYSPIEQLDMLCACSPKHESSWRTCLDARGIKTRTEEIKPCFYPGCSYSEPALHIPLCPQRTIYVPDEDLWDEEKVIPELKIIFPKGKALFRRFLHAGDFWVIANTCADHGSREALQEYVKAFFGGSYTLEACFSDRILDDSVLEKPQGIRIDEDEYREGRS